MQGWLTFYVADLDTPPHLSGVRCTSKQAKKTMWVLSRPAYSIGSGTLMGPTMSTLSITALTLSSLSQQNFPSKDQVTNPPERNLTRRRKKGTLFLRRRKSVTSTFKRTSQPRLKSVGGSSVSFDAVPPRTTSYRSTSKKSTQTDLSYFLIAKLVGTLCSRCCVDFSASSRR